MKFTLGWLRDYLEFDLPVSELCERLTSIGLEVEDFFDPQKKYKNFVIAQIKEINSHPNADKLKLCKVFDGKKELEIVCGASNVKKNMFVALAKEGAIIKPGEKNQFQIQKNKIRGIESNGMLCSEEELGLSESSDGIMELDGSCNVGENFGNYLNEEELFIDISLTPNRADCASVYGIARDLNASGLGKLKQKIIPNIKPDFETKLDLENRLKDSGCPQFSVRLIKDVENINSSNFIVKRFKNSDLKVISALVDTTNFINIDYCRPLHVFDYDKIEGKIVIRYSKKGEKFFGLDDCEYTLDDGMIVICDDKKIISLAGVLGGKETACDEKTKNVLIESAFFNPDDIAFAGRKLNIISDARYRFERGIDPDSVIPGLELATEMILKTCGGKSGTIVSDGIFKSEPNRINVDIINFAEILGISIDKKFIIEKLKMLGCSVESKNQSLVVLPPTWRSDIKIKEDLIEEIARLYGYEKIPSKEMEISKNLGRTTNEIQKIRKKIRTLLVSRNITEIISWSFANEKIEKLLSARSDIIKIQNPISTELSCLRSNLVGNLLTVIKNNTKKYSKNISIFELGPIFTGCKPGEQKDFVSVIRSGNSYQKNWLEKNKSFDLFDIKADFNAVLKVFGFNSSQISFSKQSKDFYHPGKSGSILIGKESIGFFGEIHPEVLDFFSIKEKTVAFEINLTKMMNYHKPKNISKKEIKVSQYQSSSRDFSFEIKQEIFASDLISTIRKIDKELIKEVLVFDNYDGDNIKSGYRAIALSVTIQSDHKTLKDDEINDISEKIVNQINLKFDAKQR